MPIDALPTPPQRNDPASFADRGDALLGALPLFVSQANALEVNVNAKEASATTAAFDAVAASNAALDATGATVWVSGTTYAIGVVRYSPINGQSYRRRTAGAGTTDPSADPTNWVMLSSVPPQAGQAGRYLQTNGAAATWADTVEMLLLAEINDTQRNVSGLQGDVTALQGDVTALQGRILFGSTANALTSLAAITQATAVGTVAGAAVGDRVIVTASMDLGARLNVWGRVTAPGTVTVYLSNPSAATATLVVGTWFLTVIKA